MFIEGSIARTHAWWNLEAVPPEGGSPGPLEPFHYNGTRINLLACDGHAVSLGPGDFGPVTGYYAEEAYTDEGVLAVYALPEFWFHIDK